MATARFASSQALEAERGEGLGEVRVEVAPTAEAEAAAIARRIRAHVARGGRFSDHAVLARQTDGLIDAPDGQYAHRATGAVDHVHIGGQQIGDAVARDRVSMSATEFHQAIGALRVGLARDIGGNVLCQFAIPEFVHILHALLPSSSACNSSSSPISANISRVRSASS